MTPIPILVSRSLPSDRISGEFKILYDFLTLCRESSYRKQRAIYFATSQPRRVVQIRPSTFLVESKRYLNTLGIPSKFHIVIRAQHRPDSFYLFCDCRHTGVYPSPFNYCSHALAVLLSICLKERSSNLLLLRDAALNKQQDFATQVLLKKDRIENCLCYACKRQTTLNLRPMMGVTQYECSRCGCIYAETAFNKLIEFNKEYKDIPLTGNEYFEHIKQKKRIHDLLTSNGWTAVEYEKAVHCRNPHTHLLNEHPYFLDVYAEKLIDGKLYLIGVEVHGKKGHGSRITIPQDKNRRDEIESQHGIKIIEFFIESQLKDVPDNLILEEIYQHVGL